MLRRPEEAVDVEARPRVTAHLPELLVVDHDPTLLRVLATHFAAEGWAVRTAPSGEVAMQLMRLRRPSIVVLDAMMPGMSGIDVCHQLQEVNPEDPPVILLTAHPKYEQVAREAGADAFITKPFKLAHLSAEVRRLTSTVPAPRPLRAVLLEDNPADAELILIELRRAGYDAETQVVDTEAGFREALSHQPDIVLADFNLPEYDGLSAIKLLRSTGSDIPLLIVSGAIGEDVAVEAIRAGASDYVLKDRLGRLSHAVAQALAAWETARSRRELEDILRQASSEVRLIMNTVTDGVLMLDEKGAVVASNLAAAAMLGRLPAELYGMRFVNLLDPEDAAAGADWVRGYLAEPGDSPKPSAWQRVVALDPDGVAVPIELRSTSLELESGRTTVVVVRQGDLVAP
ncbi:MAG: response regulator [Candidatus Dormiibacterota bacterium]